MKNFSVKSYKNTDYLRSFATISLDSAKFNFEQIKKIANCKICPVVKADGYGHGAVNLSLLYQRLKADYLAVATLDEGITLRENGITIPILILGYTPPNLTESIYVYNLTQTLFSFDYAKSIIYHCKKNGVKIKAHIKVESGMNRLGFSCNQSGIKQILSISRSPLLSIEGIFSHFSKADEGKDGKDFTDLQANRFSSTIASLKREGLEFNIKHLSNSAGILDYPQYNFDMVRAGIILYGLNPSDKIQRPLPLKEVMSVYSKVAMVKKVDSGEGVSYGGKFVTTKKTTLATIPFGYADGLFRKSCRYHFLVGDAPAPIVGRICMDQTVIDVTGLKVKEGDLVTVMGAHPLCSANTLAKINDTINYEITCAISDRVPRVYV